MICAYYFRAHMYTIVPRHVREDLRWMADHGTEAVILGVLEQDFSAAAENIELICAEAGRLGMRTFATPSRWGNLVAGSPKVPSILCAKHPDCCVVGRDGQPVLNFLGPIASVFHERTRDTFARMIERLLTAWDISGLIWDEPKALERIDFSPSAQAALGDAVADPAAQRAGQRDFFGTLNEHARSYRGDVFTGMFLYGHYADTELMRAMAATPGLDAFGMDGRPWALADGGSNDSGHDKPTKFLIDQGPSFISAAHAAGRASLALIENHALTRDDNLLMDRRLGEVARQGWDHLLYYYYPRSCEDPDASMEIVGQLHRLAGNGL